MKKVLLIILASLVFGCNDPDAPDCLKSAGDVITFSTKLDIFNSIEVNDEFIVTLRTDSDRSITITTGENLLPNVRFEIVNDRLILADDNGCRWVRDYNFPEVIITSPELTEIRQNGGGIVKSNEELTFDNFKMISKDHSGDFDLVVSSRIIQISNNDVSNFKIAGYTKKLIIGFASGDGRFDGSELEADEVEIFQRGTNDIVVHALESLSGRIISNGNVIYTKTIPPVLDVSMEGSGKLIFRE
ncbi:MAG: head GIN domain-containing protein [Bacteroidota bacterium]